MRYNHNMAILNQGTKSNIKKYNNIRIISVNAKGFNTTYKEKIQHLINEYKEREVDIIFLSKTNIKQISIIKDSVNHKLKEID